MASIERRQIRGQERFLVRYRDPSGKQKARTFASEKAAVDYEAEVRTDMPLGRNPLLRPRRHLHLAGLRI